MPARTAAGSTRSAFLTAISSTIAYNSVAAGGAGGGIDASSGTTTLYDTIVAANTAGTGTTATTSDLSGNVATASSHNLIGGNGGGLTNGVNGNLVGVGLANLKLGTLADNGGPTETIALLAGSPAIAAGKRDDRRRGVPTVDQRGIARPASKFDIGAFQSALPVTTVPGGSTSTGSAQTIATITTPALIQSSVVSNAVASSHAKVGKGANAKSKLKVVAKKAHPGGGAAAKFHKAAAPKARHTVAIKKAHPVALKKAHPIALKKAHLAAIAKKH